MSNAALSAYPPLPQGEPLTLRRLVEIYLQHLAQLVDQGEYSAVAFNNAKRDLYRFVLAWSVTFGDGRHWIVPAAEPRRVDAGHKPLVFGAVNEAEAIEVALKLASKSSLQSLVASSAADAVVCRLGDRPVMALQSDDLGRWLQVNPQFKSPHTRKRVIDTIFRCLVYAEDERYILECPMRRKRLPMANNRQKKPTRRAAVDKEYITLMRHGCRQFKRSIFYGRNAGVRTCEMCTVIWPDVKWDQGIIETYRHKTARATGKPRLIPLTPKLRRFLERLFKRRPPWPEEVFLNTDGKPWDPHAFARHLRRLAKRIGLDKDEALQEIGKSIRSKEPVKRVSFYCFRHGFATDLRKAGMHRDNVSKLTGHENPEMLDAHYDHSGEDTEHLNRLAKEADDRRRRHRNPKLRRPKPTEEGEGESNLF